MFITISKCYYLDLCEMKTHKIMIKLTLMVIYKQSTAAVSMLEVAPKLPTLK